MADRVVKAVIVRVGGKDVKLPIAEAKKLYDALGELFDRPIVRVEEVRPWPYPVYTRPYIWWSTCEGVTTGHTSGSYTLRMNEEPEPSQTVG